MNDGGSAGAASFAFFPLGLMGRGLSSTRKAPKRPVRLIIGTPAGESRSICWGSCGRPIRSTGIENRQEGTSFGLAALRGLPFAVSVGAGAASTILSL